MDTHRPTSASVARMTVGLLALMLLVLVSGPVSAQVPLPEVDTADPVGKVKDAVDEAVGGATGDGGAGDVLPGGSEGSTGTPSVEGTVDAAGDLVAPSSSETSATLPGSSGSGGSDGGSTEPSGAPTGGRERSGAGATELRSAAAGEVRDPKQEAGDQDTGALIAGGHAVVGAGGSGGAGPSCPPVLGALCLLFGSTGEGRVEVGAAPVLALTGIGVLVLLLLGMGLLGTGTGALRAGRDRPGRA
jgi:hypothetical protein